MGRQILDFAGLKHYSVTKVYFRIKNKKFCDAWQIHDNWPSVLFAMAGGLALGLGNLVSQYAWVFAGLSVTNIICSSMTVVIGTTMNYFLDGRINRAEILFGVACFLIAVFLGAAVHSSNAKDDEQKLNTVERRGVELRSDFAGKDNKQESVVPRGIVLPDPEQPESGGGEDCDAAGQAKPGTAEFIIQVEKRRSIKVTLCNRILKIYRQHQLAR